MRHPAKLRQKDRDARWTVKYAKAKPSEDGAKRVDLAIPAFGYKDPIGIDRAHGLIRTWTATDASRHDGAQLENLIDKRKHRQRRLGRYGLSLGQERGAVGRQRFAQPNPSQKAQGQADAGSHRQGQRQEVEDPRFVERVFAREKGPMGLLIRTIGMARAKVKIGLATSPTTWKRAAWLMTRGASA